jgi:hypothetical protein
VKSLPSILKVQVLSMMAVVQLGITSNNKVSTSCLIRRDLVKLDQRGDELDGSIR